MLTILYQIIYAAITSEQRFRKACYMVSAVDYDDFFGSFVTGRGVGTSSQISSPRSHLLLKKMTRIHTHMAVFRMQFKINAVKKTGYWPKTALTRGD